MMTNRRLFRPSLREFKQPQAQDQNQKVNINQQGNLQKRKSPPAEQTNAENYYYLKQMSSRTPMIITMNDGEELRGWIEWYDKTCIKINRYNEPNLLVFKRNIKYISKERE